MQTLLQSGERKHLAGESRTCSSSGRAPAASALPELQAASSLELEEETRQPCLPPSSGNAGKQMMETGDSDLADDRRTSRRKRGPAMNPVPVCLGITDGAAASSSEESLHPSASVAEQAFPASNVKPGLADPADGNKKLPEKQLRSSWRLPRQPVRSQIPIRLNRRPACLKRGGPSCSSQSLLDGPNAFNRSWTKLQAAGSAASGANAAAAAGKRAARLGREAAKRSAMKAAKAVTVLKAVQEELESATRLQRMLGIQKYTEDEHLQQLAETEALLSPGECLQYDLNILRYYTSTEKDIELRNRRAKAFIYSPATQIFMAMVIIFNILFLGISTMEVSLKTEEALPPKSRHDEELLRWNKPLLIFLTVCNSFFAVIFFVEMVLRIKCDRLAYFTDVVNVTDFVNAWLGILDLFFSVLHFTKRGEVEVFQSVTAVLRLVRLLRVLRFIRILKAFLPMRILVDGMKASFFSLVYAMCFFIVLVYGFAVFFTTAFGTTLALQEYWGDLFTSMYTLFLILTMTNWDLIAAKTAAYYGWAKAVVILYTVFSFFVLFNVVTGIHTLTFCARKSALSAQSARAILELSVSSLPSLLAAVIVEAFSSAASRLQGEAAHFAMFEECQEDEKIFCKALTKGCLLSAVSGVSINKRQAVARPSRKAPHCAHHTYREAAERGRSDVEASTKSTQLVQPAVAPNLEKRGRESGEECPGKHGYGEEQQRGDELYAPTEKRAFAATRVPAFRCDTPFYNVSAAEPTNDKPRAPKKLSSSLFTSFVGPSPSLVQPKDSHVPPRLSPPKRLRCVRGVLTMHTANVPDRPEGNDTANATKEFPGTSQPHEVLLPTVPVVEQPDAARLLSAVPAKDPFPADAENAVAVGDSTLSTLGDKKKTTLQPNSEDQSALNGPAGVPPAQDFLDTSPALDTDGLRNAMLVGTPQAEEAFSDSQAAIREDVQDFGIDGGRTYDGLPVPGSLTTVPEVSQGVPCIDLRRFSPIQVLGTRAVQLAMRVRACYNTIRTHTGPFEVCKAHLLQTVTRNYEAAFCSVLPFSLFQKCGISYIQAYDCLNILLQKGFEEVTVAGFLTCCRRVVGRPTARQLFILELDLDRAFRNLNAKVARLLSLIQIFIGDEGLIALPSTFSSGPTKSGLLS